MGIDAWLDRKPAPTPRQFVIEHYPGYTDAILECLTCEAQFEGLFITEPHRTLCPRCQNRGVNVVRVIRKIYLQ